MTTAKKAAPAAAKEAPKEEPEVEQTEAADSAADALQAAGHEVTHAGELCAECGVHPLGDGATHFSCIHGAWANEDGTWVKQ